MKTRNYLLVAAVAAFMSTAQVMAQDTNSTTRQSRADINELLDKRCNRMCASLKLDDATAAKFNALYKEYLKEMRACRPTPCKNGDKTQCTDADKKARIEKGMECREKMVKTQKKYYAQFEKFLNAEQLQTVFCTKRHGQRYDKASRRHGKCDYKGRKNCDAAGHNNCDARGHKSHHNCK